MHFQAVPLPDRQPASFFFTADEGSCAVVTSTYFFRELPPFPMVVVRFIPFAAAMQGRMQAMDEGSSQLGGVLFGLLYVFFGIEDLHFKQPCT